MFGIGMTSIVLFGPLVLLLIFLVTQALRYKALHQLQVEALDTLKNDFSSLELADRRLEIFKVVLIKRLITFVFGYVLIFVGTQIYYATWYLSEFIGASLITVGMQIALWSVGISAEILGNVPYRKGSAA
jgi:hypothetical protein